MSEHKSGLYRTEAGRLLAVVVGSDDGGHPFVAMDGTLHVGYTTSATLSKAEYLGPAVIGDDGGSRGSWISKAVELRADAENLREMLGKSLLKRAELDSEVSRLKRGDWTAEELQEFCHRVSEDDKHAFKGGCVDYWTKLFGDAGLEYSVGEGGVERYGFDTVTVFRREGREASVRCFAPIAFRAIDSRSVKEFEDREAAEAWCVEQLKPKWRKAREDGSDNGKACRVRDHEGDDMWVDGGILFGYCEGIQCPWITINVRGIAANYTECEVQD